MPLAAGPSWSPRAIWTLVAVVFVVGAALRIVALDVPRYSAGVRVSESSRWHPRDFRRYLEQDERIYVALVEQLDAGAGYTLQGHPVLDDLVAEQYGQKLFFHPPGGAALFWIAYQVAGDRGWPLLQVAMWMLFFWSLMWLGTFVLHPWGPIEAGALAVLGAITPLMAHVAGRLWLDGPLLAFATLAAALFVGGVSRERTSFVVASGVVLGCASLIKVTAFLVVPGVVLVAWALTPGMHGRRIARAAALSVALAAAIQLPWEIMQWIVVGQPFPEWAGKPAARLVATNRYVHFLTVVRSPWMYITMLPQVIWTMVPSIALWWWARRMPGVGRSGAALIAWIAAVIAVHVALGASGYSKVLRYTILLTPASALLFAVAVRGAMIRARMPRQRGPLAVVLFTLAAAGLCLEIAQGIRTSLHDNARFDLIRPLTGLPGMDR